MQDYFSLSMTTRDVNQISALGLAHCGDAVFELLVRSWLCLTKRYLKFIRQFTCIRIPHLYHLIMKPNNSLK